MRLDHPLRSLPFRLVATAIALAACAAVVTSGEARSPAPKRKPASPAAGSTAAAPAPRLPGMVEVIDPVPSRNVRGTPEQPPPPGAGPKPRGTATARARAEDPD